MAIFDELLARLSQPPAAPPDTVGAPFQRRELAVFALLIELAQGDPQARGGGKLATIDDRPRRFGLDATSARA